VSIIVVITWIIALAALVGTLANAFKLRWCFLIWMVTNAFWVGYDLYIGSYAQSALFASYFVISIVGWFQWKTKPSGASPNNERK